MTGKATILIVSNLVTIAVTVFSVFYAIHYKHQNFFLPKITNIGSGIDDDRKGTTAWKGYRFLATTSVSTATTHCCDCTTGAELMPDLSNDDTCFSAGSTVQVQGEIIPRRLDQVQIGDLVHVGSNKYEPVYSFGHYDPYAWGREFVRLETAVEGKTLTLSTDHMVLTHDNDGTKIFQPAATIKSGDWLYLGNRDVKVMVQKVSFGHEERGMLAPFTPSGQIVVDGFVVSAFVQLPGTPQKFLFVDVSAHWLAHSFEFPHRVICHYLDACPNEIYTSGGLSTWIATPLEVARWILKSQSSTLRNACLAMAIIIFAIFNLVEIVLFQLPLLGMITVICVYVYRLSSQRDKKCWRLQISPNCG